MERRINELESVLTPKPKRPPSLYPIINELRAEHPIDWLDDLTYAKKMLTGCTLVGLTGDRQARRQQRELESAIKLIYKYDLGEPPSTAKWVIRSNNEYCHKILWVLIKSCNEQEPKLVEEEKPVV